MIQENVRGAIPWVGRSQWHYGSYHLWGNVPALMPITMRAQKANPDGTNHGQGSWFAIADSKNRGSKNTGGSWFNVGSPGQTVTNNNPARGPRGGQVRHPNHPEYMGGGDGVKQSGISGTRANGKGDRWFQDGAAASGSKSSARKAASARIAKIPFPLAQWIARVTLESQFGRAQAAPTEAAA